MVTWNTISKVTLVCGVATFGIQGLVVRQANIAAQESELLKIATELVRTHPQVSEILGQPIVFGKASVSKRWSDIVIEDGAMHVKAPVKGPNDEGVLYAVGGKRTENKHADLKKIEMTFNSRKGMRAILYDSTESSAEEKMTVTENKNQKLVTEKVFVPKFV